MFKLGFNWCSIKFRVYWLLHFQAKTVDSLYKKKYTTNQNTLNYTTCVNIHLSWSTVMTGFNNLSFSLLDRRCAGERLPPLDPGGWGDNADGLELAVNWVLDWVAMGGRALSALGSAPGWVGGRSLEGDASPHTSADPDLLPRRFWLRFWKKFPILWSLPSCLP